ncbi:MAG: vWA domain-containing protein, partial [Promethearchaeota archaeon]
MSERLPENIVLCIDTSRSMFRTDYQPNRFKASINAIKKLINERFNADPMTFFSIVRFSDKAKKLIDFTNSKEDLFRVLD